MSLIKKILGTLSVVGTLATAIELSKSELEIIEPKALLFGQANSCHVTDEDSLYHMQLIGGQALQKYDHQKSFISPSKLPGGSAIGDIVGYGNKFYAGNRDGWVVIWEKGVFDTLPQVPASLGNREVNSLAVAPNGDIYAGVYESLYKYSNGEWSLWMDIDVSGSMLYHEGYLYASGRDTYRIDPNKNIDTLDDVSFRYFTPTRDGGIFASEYVTVEYDKDLNESRDRTTFESVRAIYEDHNGLIWLGYTDEHKITIYDPAKNEFLVTIDSLMGEDTREGRGIVGIVEGSKQQLFICGTNWAWVYNGDAHLSDGSSSEASSSQQSSSSDDQGTSSEDEGSSSSDDINPITVQKEGLTLIANEQGWLAQGELEGSASVQVHWVGFDGSIAAMPSQLGSAGVQIQANPSQKQRPGFIRLQQGQKVWILNP